MKSKYRNKKVKLGDMTFDSKKECDRYLELCMLQRAKKITDLETQVPFELIPAQRDPATGKLLERACNYVADFTYHEAGRLDKLIVEDTKGVRTSDYIIKRKLMLHVHGIRIREI